MSFQRLKTYLITFNLFRDSNVTNNRHKLRNQIISTRILILLLSITLVGVLGYWLVDEVTEPVTIEKISLSQYQNLKTRPIDGLQCPCSNLSIPYEIFISLQATTHNACLVDWNPLIDILFQFTETLTNNHDFRFTAALQFYLFNLMCSSVKQIIMTQLVDFNATLFNNAFLIEEILLQEQVNEFVDQSIQRSTTQFVNLLQMIRINTFGSQFMSGVRSNYVINTINNYGDLSYFRQSFSFPQIYEDNCNCSTSFLCTAPATIYDDSEIYTIIGFRTGCFVLESLLSSSLECFYNSTCVNQLRQYIPFNASIFLPPSNKFNKTDSIETMLKELMVEKWSMVVNYTAYFGACQAQTCSYTYTGRRTLLFLATTILGLIGGLVKLLQTVVPVVVDFVRRKRQVFRTSDSHSDVNHFRRFINQINITKRIRLINLFRSPDSHTPRDIRNEFLSTRVYLVLFTAALIIIIEYYALITSTQFITLRSPSFDTVVRFNDTTLICPCSTTLIPYEVFVSVLPTFHPICYSDFINDTWLNALDASSNDEIVQFRVPFRLLSLLCQLAYNTLYDQLRQFYKSRILDIEVSSEDYIRAQTLAIIEKEISTARLAFFNSFKRVRNISKINSLLSANEIFQTNRAELRITFYGVLEFLNIFNENFLRLSCQKSARIANINFDQFYTSCDAIEALLTSTLSSFYDADTVEAFSYHVLNSSSRSLNQSNFYLTTATVQSILDALMLDTYSTNISYRSYFDKCHPRLCTYSVVRGQSFIQIVLAVIGLIGGLVTVLHITIGLLVQFITRPKKIKQARIPWRQNIRLLISSIRESIHSFNLFRHSGKSHWHEIVSTRIFILSFSSILLIFLFYTSLSKTIILITITAPTYTQFVELDNQYLTTLTCPCSTISVPHDTFVTFKPQFHQVCSSHFVSDAWLYYSGVEKLQNHLTNDFRSSSYYTFYAIYILCQSSQQVVYERITTFSANEFVASKALNEEQLRDQIDELVKALILVGEQQLSFGIKLIRDTTYGNQLLAATFSNIDMSPIGMHFVSAMNLTVGLSNKSYSSCNCLTSSSCVQQAGFYFSDGNPTIYLHGFYVGCYMLEAVLLSTTKCLFSRTCLSYILNQFENDFYLPVEVNVLDATQNSSYSTNTTFVEMLDHLMVETWGCQISHRDYYDICQPVSCTYSYIARREFVYVLTMLFGIIGGLNKVLKLIVPWLTSILLYIRRNTKVAPVQNHSSLDNN